MKTEEIKFKIGGIFPTPIYKSFDIKKITEIRLLS